MTGLLGLAARRQRRGTSNAIPAVCAAEPGVVSILDLPLFTTRVPARS
jgi:hypothetical protein